MLPKPVLDYLNQAAKSARVAVPEHETSLFKSGLLDSFSLVDFVAVLETECNVRVSDAELRPENFDTIAKIETFITRAQAA